MDFSDALRALKDGQRVRRAFWQELDGRLGTWVELAEPQLPDGRKMIPQLVCPLPDGRVVAFNRESWDLLADDWEIAEP